MLNIRNKPFHLVHYHRHHSSPTIISNHHGSFFSPKQQFYHSYDALLSKMHSQNNNKYHLNNTNNNNNKTSSSIFPKRPTTTKNQQFDHKKKVNHNNNNNNNNNNSNNNNSNSLNNNSDEHVLVEKMSQQLANKHQLFSKEQKMIESVIRVTSWHLRQKNNTSNIVDNDHDDQSPSLNKQFKSIPVRPEIISEILSFGEVKNRRDKRKRVMQMIERKREEFQMKKKQQKNNLLVSDQGTSKSSNLHFIGMENYMNEENEKYDEYDDNNDNEDDEDGMKEYRNDSKAVEQEELDDHRFLEAEQGEENVEYEQGEEEAEEEEEWDDIERELGMSSSELDAIVDEQFNDVDLQKYRLDEKNDENHHLKDKKSPKKNRSAMTNKIMTMKMIEDEYTNPVLEAQRIRRAILNKRGVIEKHMRREMERKMKQSASSKKEKNRLLQYQISNQKLNLPKPDCVCPDHVNWVFDHVMQKIGSANEKKDFAKYCSPNESNRNATLPQIAFAGRSNVGKSSLINSIIRRKIMKTSDRPGETRDVAFYRVGKIFSLVDLPGYGFAFAEPDQIAKWNQLMRDYFTSSPNLKMIYLLIDSRHGFKFPDYEMMELFETAGVDYRIVLTKTDTVFVENLARMVYKLRNDYAQFINRLASEGKIEQPSSSQLKPLMVSSQSHSGIAAIKEDIVNHVGFELDVYNKLIRKNKVVFL